MLSPLPRATSDMREKADNDSKIVSLKALNQKYVLISPNLTMQGFNSTAKSSSSGSKIGLIILNLVLKKQNLR